MRSSVLFAVALLTSCVGPSPEVPLDQDFQLALGHGVTIAGTGRTLTFDAVPEDSRCPSDAVCVWAGNATVELRVSSPGGDSSVVLNTLSEPRSVTLGNLRLELRALDPARRANIPIPANAYRATLRVAGS